MMLTMKDLNVNDKVRYAKALRARDAAAAEVTEMTVVKTALRQGVVSVYAPEFGEKEVFVAALERIPKPRMAFINKVWQVIRL